MDMHTDWTRMPICNLCWIPAQMVGYIFGVKEKELNLGKMVEYILGMDKGNTWLEFFC